MNKILSSMSAFIRDEEGSQVVEYALIIALVSIVLALALGSTAGNGLQGAFAALVTRVTACFNGGAACTGPAAP